MSNTTRVHIAHVLNVEKTYDNETKRYEEYTFDSSQYELTKC